MREPAKKRATNATESRSGPSPNTRLAHTRLNTPPEGGVEVSLYRAN